MAENYCRVRVIHFTLKNRSKVNCFAILFSVRTDITLIEVSVFVIAWYQKELICQMQEDLILFLWPIDISIHRNEITCYCHPIDRFILVEE